MKQFYNHSSLLKFLQSLDEFINTQNRNHGGSQTNAKSHLPLMLPRSCRYGTGRRRSSACRAWCKPRRVPPAERPPEPTEAASTRDARAETAAPATRWRYRRRSPLGLIARRISPGLSLDSEINIVLIIYTNQ